ncbi:MAG: 2-oxo acid dehydrogenase subunit E2, partial [Acidobacteria bacterium]|nr:2-oxo acid dehydrogenase subunit E2 [Acidobacteriota bacterium]
HAVTRARVEPSPPPPAGSAAPPAGGRPAAGAVPAGPPVSSGGEGTAATAATPVAEAAATPLARRMAELAGLDLATLRGTGAGGRVGKADVQRALRAGSAVSVAPPPPPAAPGAARPGMEVAAPALAAGPHRDEPLTAARRVTAARMAQSKQTAPHFYLEVDCEADRILDRLRAAQAATAGSALPAAGGARAPDGRGGDLGASAGDLTLTDLLVRAAALALARVPLANSAWIGDAVRVFETADVAVAVAAPAGLVTPVVRNAGAKALGALAAELRDLTARARDGRLQPSEYAGGTFTISNLGMYGVSRLFAILNPPQSCILGVGAVESRPVVRDGEVRAGRTMALTLSADHRALDGATGATFLRELRAIIEHPDPIFE